MPEVRKKLSAAEKKKAREWLQKKGAKLDCSSCGHGALEIGDEMGLLAVNQPGSLLGAGYPAIVVYCANCGELRMHSAIMMGFVKADDDAE